ncbi:hypothetical protein DD829_14340 [Chryseobacterium sp. HMWF035]|nr:hypothetical protein DD829_14340 [Chryseobacterium sp. HMWF035]
MYQVKKITKDPYEIKRYQDAYKDREKQLTIIGQFYRTSIGSNGAKIQYDSSYYFDMGDLRP